jgi:hypothetical protein
MIWNAVLFIAVTWKVIIFRLYQFNEEFRTDGVFLYANLYSLKPQIIIQILILLSCDRAAS